MFPGQGSQGISGTGHQRPLEEPYALIGHVRFRGGAAAVMPAVYSTKPFSQNRGSKNLKNVIETAGLVAGQFRKMPLFLADDPFDTLIKIDFRGWTESDLQRCYKHGIIWIIGTSAEAADRLTGAGKKSASRRRLRKSTGSERPVSEQTDRIETAQRRFCCVTEPLSAAG